MNGKMASKKYTVMMAAFAMLMLTIIFVVFKVPDKPESWAYLGTLTIAVFGLAGAYLGVQGLGIDRKIEALKLEKSATKVAGTE